MNFLEKFTLEISERKKLRTLQKILELRDTFNIYGAEICLKTWKVNKFILLLLPPIKLQLQGVKLTQNSNL